LAGEIATNDTMKNTGGEEEEEVAHRDKGYRETAGEIA
jgi:hypothetical protein